MGAIEVTKALIEEGCKHFFVAHISEAIELREVYKDISIYVFHGVNQSDYKEFLAYKITPVINDFYQLEIWRKSGEACVIHFDTGMNRLGFSIHDSEKINYPNVEIIMSHMVSADEPNNQLNQKQLERFTYASHNFPLAKKSLANSSSVFLGADYHFDILRPGIALYGANPTDSDINPMLPVAKVYAKILQIRTTEEDGTVGYNATYPVKKGTKLATIGYGYADGLPWILAGNMDVFISNHKAKVLGRITMDLIVADVSNVPDNLLYPLADVEIIGENQSVEIISERAKTIEYEIFTSFGRRFNRIYS